MIDREDVQKETKSVLIAGAATIAVAWIAFSFIRVVIQFIDSLI